MNFLNSEDLNAVIDTLTEKSPRDYYQLSEIISNFKLNTPCSFKEGDWVTPNEESNLRGKGEPHLVLITYDNINFSPTVTGSPLFLYNMLVACVLSDSKSVGVYMAHSKDYEKYTGVVYGEYEVV